MNPTLLDPDVIDGMYLEDYFAGYLDKIPDSFKDPVVRRRNAPRALARSRSPDFKFRPLKISWPIQHYQTKCAICPTVMRFTRKEVKQLEQDMQACWSSLVGHLCCSDDCREQQEIGEWMDYELSRYYGF